MPGVDAGGRTDRAERNAFLVARCVAAQHASARFAEDHLHDGAQNNSDNTIETSHADRRNESTLYGATPKAVATH